MPSAASSGNSYLELFVNNFEARSLYVMYKLYIVSRAKAYYVGFTLNT